MLRGYQVVITNICRLLVGCTFTFSGFVKAIDPLGAQYKIEDYLVAMGLADVFPSILTLLAAVMLSTLELTAGILILLGIGRKFMSRVTVVFMTFMTLLTVWIYAADPVQDCGCFGEAIVLTNGQTLLKNIILLACAIPMVLWPRKQVRLLSLSTQWIVIHYAIIFSLLLSVWCLYDLPTFDFRPFHVGADIRAQMEAPDDAQIHDFFIETTAPIGEVEEGSDITEDVIYDKGYTFLLISPWLDKADDSNFGYIDEIYEYAQDNNIRFLCLTSSGEKDISHWRDITGAEYPVCLTDATLLKTVIRSNPGLILLHDGKVIGKWSHNFLPHGQQLLMPIGKAEWAHQSPDADWYRLMTVILWFFIPLILLVIADRLWAWSKWVKNKEDKELHMFNIKQN